MLTQLWIRLQFKTLFSIDTVAQWSKFEISTNLHNVDHGYEVRGQFHNSFLVLIKLLLKLYLL